MATGILLGATCRDGSCERPMAWFALVRAVILAQCIARAITALFVLAAIRAVAPRDKRIH